VNAGRGQHGREVNIIIKRAMLLPARGLTLSMCPAPAYGQVIITAAGTPWIFPASSLPALSTPLGQVQNLAMDASGNVYVADLNSIMVMQVSQSGAVTVTHGLCLTKYFLSVARVFSFRASLHQSSVQKLRLARTSDVIDQLV
jgi:hypothetical protein